jgi:hypothetical protein
VSLKFIEQFGESLANWSGSKNSPQALFGDLYGTTEADTAREKESAGVAVTAKSCADTKPIFTARMKSCRDTKPQNIP